MHILKSMLLIAAGAGIGANMRWGLSLMLNPLFKSVEFGTLISNYLGCFIMGIAMSIFFSYPHLSTDVRVFLVTGFLGSLTTFSSFSGEVVERFMSDKWLNAVGVIGMHLSGCLLFTALGVFLWRSIQ